MKTIILLTSLLSLSAWSQSYTVSRDTLNGSLMPFISHQGPGAFDSYLSMELPYAPVKKLFKNVEERTRTKLITRGEAHITVVTPPEFDGELKSYITMDEIDAIAKELDIQKSQFNLKCLGSGSLKIENKIERTYYLVVESKDLLNIRKKILETIRSRGGSPVLFKPEKFFPHVTVGFSKRDLHESDGLFKDASTCIEKVEID